MKRTYFILLLSIGFLYSCSEAPKDDSETKDPVKEEVSGTELLNAYADTLTMVADSLELVYNSAISEFARTPDSLSWIEAKYKMSAQSLEQQLVDLNNSIENLLTEKKVSEEEYQRISIDIDMSGVSAAMEKLKLLGMNLGDKITGKDSIPAQ